jgi:cysteine desulfurase / selenocysteine lyase
LTWVEIAGVAHPPRIYLDNAATSFPKPERVYQVMDDYQRRLGTAAGRGATRAGAEVAARIDAVRRSIARLIGAGNPSGVIFTLNGTDSLNLVLHGWLKPGEHVVTTRLEHNSVLRPLSDLAARGIEVTAIAPRSDGRVAPEDFLNALLPTTTLAVVTQASNVTGIIQPVEQIAAGCRERGVAVLVDAAQTAGCLPIDVEQLGCDFLAMPGHKGLLGPLGTGVLWIRPGREERLDAVRQGGTGTRSEQSTQPTTLPDKYESGNLNVPGIFGLGAGVEWVLERGVESIARHDAQLVERLSAGLSTLPAVEIIGPLSAPRVGLVSFRIPGLDPGEAAVILEESFGIECRAGLHCAATVHADLGTLDHGGTLRFSVGPFVTLEMIDRAVAAVAAMAAAFA